MNPKVDEYINKQPSPQKEICNVLRDLILKTFSKIDEGFKNGVPWYEDKFYIGSFRDSVNLGFAIKGLSKEDLDLFDGKGEYMRHKKFRTPDDIDGKQIKKLLKLVWEKSIDCH